MRSLALLLPLAVGCAKAPRLGSVPADQAVLATTPGLAHLAEQLPPDGPRTVEALVRSGRWDFKGPPDPSAWFAAEATGESAAIENGVELKVLTYNTGLLDRQYFGGEAVMPEVPHRATWLPETLLSTGQWDVLLLQEVWEWDQVDRFAQAAQKYGYVWYAGSKKAHVQHGLLMLVKKELVGEDGDRTEVQFDAQRKIERWPGPNIKRGYLTWSFTHAPTGRPVRIATAHPQAFPQFWQVRTLQARQLALDLAASPDDTTVVLGIDLNAGPYYPKDSFGIYHGKPMTGWWRNSLTYPLIRHYGGLTDAQGVRGLAGDVAAMEALPPFTEQWLEVPLGGVCAAMPPVFTGTDCNPQYAHNYIGEEYPARLDYVFTRAPEGSLRVVEAGRVYDAPVALGSREMVPSDHYGVAAVLELALAPGVVPPAETVPAEAAPAETVPAETVPDETVPAEAVPEEAAPAETVPAEAAPEETAPAPSAGE